MSKSLNLMLPVLGGIGLVLGGAFAVASMGYGDNQIAALQDRTAQLETSAASAARQAATEAARAQELSVQLASATRSLTAPVPQRDGAFGLGRAALPEEIAAWDVDILPDGRGLPVGSGDVWTGDELFAEQCAACHGDFAEGVDNWPVLAGGFDTLGDEDPVKTVGSYWPYLSTVWDYVHRSMPFGAAGTLTADETYAIVAYILYSNNMVDDDFVLSDQTFMDVQMYNAEGFVLDDRPDLEYGKWSGEPCMTACKDEVQVTMRSVFLVETPPEGGSNSIMNHNRDIDLPAFTSAGASFVPAPEVQPQAAEVSAPADAPAAPTNGDDAALIQAGEKVFARCRSCHQIGDGARNRSGPILTGVMDRPMGGADGFKYSDAIQTAAAEGRVWDTAEMTGFLTKPKSYLPGTKMNFPGLKTQDDITALIAYLRSMGG